MHWDRRSCGRFCHFVALSLCRLSVVPRPHSQDSCLSFYAGYPPSLQLTIFARTHTR